MDHNTPVDPITAEIGELQKPLRGRRPLSWFLFSAALGLALLLPVLAIMFSPSAPSAPNHSTPFALDAVWNPGPVANAHQAWANDCAVCHSSPFSRVKDADCVACHKTTPGHVDPKATKVAALEETRCATCHRDHQGAFGLALQNKHFEGQNCAACHADIKKTMPETETLNVRDFGQDHPEFRVQVLAGVSGPAVGTERLRRVRQAGGTAITEATTLKFPHDVHLLSAGVRSPEGLVKMTCDGCHKPNADRSSFQPVSMKEHCQSCHALKFELALTNREVPHGSVDEVLSTLREFYSYVSLNRVQLDGSKLSAAQRFIALPGKDERLPSFVNGAGDARARAAASATDLFERTSCVVCHTVNRLEVAGKAGTPGADLPQWQIAPVAGQHAWMPKARFEHSAHEASQCTDCHSAPESKKASDVLMPAIAVCRDCHMGAEKVANKVASDCGTCHGFHMAPHQVKGPAAAASTAMPSAASSVASTVALTSQGQTAQLAAKP
jgi:predicted CXXCH cytochrome family protein